MDHEQYTPRQGAAGQQDGYGEIRLHLKELIEERGISLNQLSYRAQMQRSQLRSYRDNQIRRLDIDILKRLCCALDCGLSDLVEYIPPGKNGDTGDEGDEKEQV